MFGTRAAEHIASRRDQAAGAVPPGVVAAAVQAVVAVARPESSLTVAQVKGAVQARMSDAAGPFCDGPGVAQALAEARALNARIQREGIACARPAERARAVQWQQMALASEAVLTALDHYIAQGGGSRGARAILDAAGSEVPHLASGPLEALRFRRERAQDRERQIVLRYAQGAFVVFERENRAAPHERPFFERDWPAWLTGAIYAAP